MITDLFGKIKTAALVAAGAAIILSWDHYAPWGLGRKLEAETAKYETAHAANAYAVEQTKGWSRAYNAVGDMMAQHLQSASTALSAASTRCSTSADRSFNAGISLGRSLERTQYVPSNSSNPAHPAIPDNGLVPVDLRTAWPGNSSDEANR